MDFIENLDAIRRFFPPGQFGRSAARVEFQNLTEDLSLSRGARLFHNPVARCLLRCAAALRGTLDAASGALSGFFHGGQQALNLSISGQPNKSLEPTATQRGSHR